MENRVCRIRRNPEEEQPAGTYRTDAYRGAPVARSSKLMHTRSAYITVNNAYSQRKI